MTTQRTPNRYGQWAGNPNGRPENLADCIEVKRSYSAWDHGTQCTRKRGHGPDGLYCKQHAKRHTVDRAAYDHETE